MCTFFERWGDLGLAMVMYRSTAMADMVSTADTMDMWVMKLVTWQKITPNIQSLATWLKLYWEMIKIEDESQLLENEWCCVLWIKIVLLLILHEDKVECTVEDCVYQICHTEVEDEQICDRLHFSVLWQITRLATLQQWKIWKSLTKHNPEDGTVPAHSGHNHHTEGNVPEYLQLVIHSSNKIILQTRHTTLKLRNNLDLIDSCSMFGLYQPPRRTMFGNCQGSHFP